MNSPTDIALVEEIRQAGQRPGIILDGADVKAVCDFLLGQSKSDIAQVSASLYARWWLPRIVIDVLFVRQPEKITLTTLDQRALDLLVAQKGNQSALGFLFEVLSDSPLVAEVISTLLKTPLFKPGLKVGELLGMILRGNVQLTKDDRATALGRALLPHLLKHPREMLEAAKSSHVHEMRLRLIQLLLTVQPPELDLADNLAALDKVDSGECAALLMQVDQRRFIKHALRLTEPGYPGDDKARLDALRTLMTLDPKTYADRATAAARTAASSHGARIPLQCFGLEAAYKADPLKYWPLVEEALCSPIGQLAVCAARLSAQAPAEQSLPALRKCVAEASTDVALVALQSLLQVGGLSEALQALTHSSRQIRAKATEWLVNHKQEAAPAIGAYLDHRNVDVRLAAVDVLNALGDEPARALLQARLDKETSVPVKQAILDALSTIEMASGAGPAAGPATPQDVAQAAAAIEAEGQKLLSPAGKSPLPWPDVAAMPPLHWKNGAVVPPVVVTYLLYQQSRSKEAQLVPAVQRALRSIERGSAVPFAEMLYGDWLGRGAQAKEAWCLALAGALGDDRLAQALRGQVDEWTKHARGALAAKAVWAIAAVGSDLALGAVYDIGRRIKRSPRPRRGWASAMTRCRTASCRAWGSTSTHSAPSTTARGNSRCGWGWT
jgi:hypothetical protein